MNNPLSRVDEAAAVSAVRPEQSGTSRRRFLSSTAAVGITAGLPLAIVPNRDSPAVAAPPKTQPSQQTAAWKMDVTIYDRPDWSSTSFGLPVLKQKTGELVVGFQVQREDSITDDFYSAHAEWVFLSSKDNGKSWKQNSLNDVPLDSRWLDRSAHCTNGWPVELADGTLVNVVEVTPTRLEQRERLEKLGIGHLWFPDSTFGWDLWPASHADRLKQEGIYVFDHPGPHLPEGIVATHARQPAVTISHDRGKTWG